MYFKTHHCWEEEPQGLKVPGCYQLHHRMYKTLYIALHETNMFPPEDGCFGVRLFPFGALDGLFFGGENVSFRGCSENNHLVGWLVAHGG